MLQKQVSKRLKINCMNDLKGIFFINFHSRFDSSILGGDLKGFSYDVLKCVFEDSLKRDKYQ